LARWVKLLVNPGRYSAWVVTNSTWLSNGITGKTCCPYPIRHSYTWNEEFLSTSHCWWL